MSSTTQTPSASKQTTAVNTPTSTTPHPKFNGTPIPIAAMTLPANSSYSADDRLIALRTQSSTCDEAFYRRKATTTNSLAEALFYAKFPSSSAARAAIAPGISAEELVTSLAVQLVLTTQLLETRRVRKDIALRAIAKRRDGFSDGTMQEVWDEAWDEVHKEEGDRRKKAQEARQAKKAARGEQGKGEEKKTQNKNGSQKAKDRKAKPTAAAEGLIVKDGGGWGKDSYLNGGVNCTKKEFMLGGPKKN